MSTYAEELQKKFGDLMPTEAEKNRTPEERQRAMADFVAEVRNTDPDTNAIISDAADQMLNYIYSNRIAPQDHFRDNSESNAA